MKKELRVSLRRIISSVLVVALLIGSSPIQVFATNKENISFQVTELDNDWISKKRGRTLAELDAVYEIKRDSAGKVRHVSFEEDNVPTVQEVISLFGANDSLLINTDSESHMYQVLKERYGLTESQIVKGIEQHGDKNAFMENLNLFQITKNHYIISEDVETEVLDLIVSGFSNSEAVAAVVASRASGISLTSLKEAKTLEILKEKNAETKEFQKQENQDQLNIEDNSIQPEISLTLAKQLGVSENTANDLFGNVSLTSQAFETMCDEVRDKLFSEKVDSTRTSSSMSDASISSTTDSEELSYAPEDKIGKYYTYMDNGNISVASNSGDYTYTETDLSLPGVNGLDLELERQFTSVMATDGTPYGRFNEGYDDTYIYFVYYQAYEWKNYDELQTKAGMLLQPEYEGPYYISDYTYDIQPADVYDLFYASEYNQAVEFREALSNIYVSAYDANGNEVYLLLRPSLVGMAPSYDEACENRVRSYSYTIDSYNMGTGWRFNFPSIEKYRARQFSGVYDYWGDETTYKCRLILPDGSRYEIDFNADNESNLVGYPFDDMWIEKSDSGKYSLNYLDGRTIHFNNEGLLESIKDAFGNEIVVEYSNDTDFTITDTLGNIIVYSNEEVSEEQYYDDKNGLEWLYNTKNILKLNGNTIRTYYSYYDEDDDVQYLKFVVNEIGEITQYKSTYNTRSFNSFSAAGNNSSNDGKLGWVRLKEVEYPDGMEIHLYHTTHERSIGETGRMEYYALLSVENYDSVEDEYSRDTIYEYGDFDGVYTPKTGYKTVTTECYATEVETTVYEFSKTSNVTYFNPDHRRDCEYTFCYQAMPYNHGIETEEEAEEWLEDNSSYLQSEVYYSYKYDVADPDEDEAFLPKIVETYYNNETGSKCFELVEKFEYNDNAQLVKQTKPNGERVFYTYDSTCGLLETTEYYQDDDTEIVITNTLSDVDRKIGATTVTANNVVQSKVEYDYDADGNLISQKDYTTDTAYNETQYVYTNSALPTEVKTIGVKNADGTLVTGSPGYTAGTIAKKTTYNDRGWPLTVTDANGNVTTYTYDALGQVTKVVYPDGSQQTFVYDTENRTVTITDPLGTVTRNTYDGAGNLREIYDVTNSTILQKNTYFCGELVEEIIYGDDSPDQTRYYEYDTLGRPTETGYRGSTGNALHRELTDYYDGSGRIEKKIIGDDYAPDREEISYLDEMGNVVETDIVYDVLSEDVETNDYNYDYMGNCISFDLDYSAEGGVVKSGRYTYDASGNVLTETDYYGNTITNTYDLSGNLISTTDAKGSVTTYTYDALGRLIKVQQPFEEVNGTIYYAVTEYKYDANGNMISESISNQVPGESESTRVTEYEYDSKNQVTTATMYGPEANYTQYQYDAAGNLLKVYTGLNSKLSFSDSGVPSGSDTDYAVTSYEYDDRSNMVKMTDALGQSETYVYDQNGSVTSKTDRNGNTTSYTYDEMGQPLTTSVSNADGEVTDTLTYTYTENGLLRSQSNGEHTSTYTYDVLGRVIEEETDNTTIFNTFNPLGDRTKRLLYQDMTLLGTATYGYDGNGRMTSVTDQGATASYTYDANGNRASVTYSNGNTENYTYNLANFPVTLTNKNGTAILSSFDYTYAVDGNVVEKTENTGKVTTYAYDGMNRLTDEVQKENGATVQSYSYEFDDFGNRAKLTAAGEDAFVTTYSYDANNRLLEDVKVESDKETKTLYFYDPNGNQVSKTAETLTVSTDTESTLLTDEFDSFELNWYNGFNQLIGVKANGVTAEYSYAPSGLRLSKTIDDQQTDFILDGDYVVAELHDDALTTYYARGLNLFASFIGEDQNYYLYNGHGDVVQLTDTSGAVSKTYEYDAFGNEKDPASNDLNPFRYCAEYYDAESGRYYLRTRYYDPVIGRMEKEDCYWSHANRILDQNGRVNYITILQSNNLYLYAIQNPTYYVDPNGENIASVLGTASGSALADGPFPIGDIIAVGTIIYAGGSWVLDRYNEYKKYLDEQKIQAINDVITKIKTDDPDATIIFRYGKDRNKDMTPRPFTDYDGLSYSLVFDPYKFKKQGGVSITTMELINSTGFLKAENDHANHVRVYPTDVSQMERWRASWYTANVSPHFYTQLLKSLSLFVKK